MIAFDYKRQQWRTGREGARLMLEQAEESIAFLLSEKGEEYARFAGVNRADAIVRACNVRRECKAELGEVTAMDKGGDAFERFSAT